MFQKQVQRLNTSIASILGLPRDSCITDTQLIDTHFGKVSKVMQDVAEPSACTSDPRHVTQLLHEPKLRFEMLLRLRQLLAIDKAEAQFSMQPRLEKLFSTKARAWMWMCDREADVLVLWFECVHWEGTIRQRRRRERARYLDVGKNGLHSQNPRCFGRL